MLKKRFHADTTPLSGVQPTRIHQDRQSWTGRVSRRGTRYRNFAANRLRRFGYAATTTGPQTVRWPIAQSGVHHRAAAGSSGWRCRRPRFKSTPATWFSMPRNGYSAWSLGGPLSHVLRKDLAPAYAGAPNVARLLFYYSMSDIHIADKESPAQPIYVGVNAGYGSGMSSAYSPIILSTPQVLDAAVQTINALHEMTPFDFGLSLGDAANNTQYNELRWFIDTIDGKVITPSSGVHLGAASIDYQQPFYAAGLNPAIPWYQVIGNHDQFWMGSCFENAKTRNAHIAGTIIDMGDNPASPDSVDDTGYYMGVVNGLTPYGDIYGAGPEGDFPNPPAVAADAQPPHSVQRQLNHAGLDAGVLQHHFEAGRPRFHAVEPGQRFRLLQLCAEVRYTHQVHRAGRHGERTGPAELCRRRSRRCSLSMAGRRTASRTGGQPAHGHRRTCAHQAAKFADRHNSLPHVAGAGIHRRLRAQHAAPVSQSHPVDGGTPARECRDPSARSQR